MGHRCGCAYIVDVNPLITTKKRLPPTCSVFNAEMYAIYSALKYIILTNINDYVIFTDSLSALQSIENATMDHHIKIKIMKILNSTNKNICLEWIPGHTNIRGNDLADKAAKESLHNIMQVKLPLVYGDYKNHVKKFINEQWQLQWSI